MFGKKSEDGDKLGLGEAFDENGAEIPDPSTEEQTTQTVAAYTRTTKPKTGRNIDTSKLPREIVIHELSKVEKHCSCGCGIGLVKIGEERSEQLEYIPGSLKVIENVTYKYVCRSCEKFVSANKPEMPIAKSMAAPSLITEVIIKKFEYHLPFYRQAKMFSKDGIEIAANTIGNWYMQAGEILAPLDQALKQQIAQASVLQADETTVKILQKDIKGYMWCYHGCDPGNRFVYFEYNDSRGGKVVSNTLQDFQGILQTDAYSGYNTLRFKENVINLGCWAHARRKFAEVIKISKSAGKAHEMIKLIAKLYKIESDAHTKKLSFSARQLLRQELAPPILEKINTLITETIAPAQSALGKAITYTKNQWEYLTRYVNYGNAEIDNNWIENEIRPFALGRKNWLFIGNERSAHVASLFYSIIQTCRMNKIDPRKYLIYVMFNAGKMRRKEIDPATLLPQFIDKQLLL